MNICVLGAEKRFLDYLPEEEICLDEQEGQCWDLVLLLPSVKQIEKTLFSRILLIWDENAEGLLRSARTETVVSCGFAARDTLTLASMEAGRTVLSIQRAIKRLDGSAVPPQDLLLPEAWQVLPPEERVMLAGFCLLRGEL